MNYITFSYDNTRSKGLGWALIFTSLLAFWVNEHWMGAGMIFVGLVLDTRIKKEKQ